MASVPFDQLDAKYGSTASSSPGKTPRSMCRPTACIMPAPSSNPKRAYGGWVFKLTEYNQRPLRSAEILGFKVPYSVEALDAATVELLKRQGFHHPPDCHPSGFRNRPVSLHAIDDLRNADDDYMSEVYPAAIAAG